MISGEAIIINEEAVSNTTKVILFLGNNVADVSHMTAAMLSSKRKVLYADLTATRSYFYKFLGDTDEQTVIQQDVCYTKDFKAEKDVLCEYDVIILCGETDCKLNIPIDRIYVVSGIDRGSISTFERILKSEVLSKKDYSLVIRASEQQVNYFKAERAFDVLYVEHEPNKVFYLPINRRDIESELLLDYSSLDIRKVSSSMQLVLWDIDEIVLDNM